MTIRRLLLATGLAALVVNAAHATMGAEEMFKRLDADHDGTISRSEVVAAAGRKYDLIASRNGGHVTLLSLGGRLSKDGIETITKGDEAKSRKADPDTVTREQYIEQAEKAFDKAKFGKSSDNRSKDDALTRGELGATSATDLIDLVQ